jgi:hypothetical protein
MNQAIISLVKDGHTFIKIICGCNGDNSEKLVEAIKNDRPDNIKDIYIMALENGLGCVECLVVMNDERVIFGGDENIDPLYRETFDDPSFNPRWKVGIADIVTILNMDNPEWIEEHVT